MWALVDLYILFSSFILHRIIVVEKNLILSTLLDIILYCTHFPQPQLGNGFIFPETA